MSDDNAADLIRLVRDCHPCSEPVNRLANLAEQQAAEIETLRRDTKMLTEPNCPAEIEKLASDLGTARYGTMLACVGLCDKAADKLRDQAAEIERLREKLREPNPARDIPTECNELLAAKDREIERLNKLVEEIYDDRETYIEQLAAANEMLAANRAEVSKLEAAVRKMSGELATTRGLLREWFNTLCVPPFNKGSLCEKVAAYFELASPASPSLERVQRQQEINAAGEANRTRHAYPASPRPEPGAVGANDAATSVSPSAGLGEDSAKSPGIGRLMERLCKAFRYLELAAKHCPPQLQAEICSWVSLNTSGEKQHDYKSDYITLWRRVVQATSIGGSGEHETHPLDRAILGVEHWAEERKQLKAEIKILYGWNRERAEANTILLQRVSNAEAALKAAQSATCPPMLTGDEMREFWFADESGTANGSWVSLAEHVRRHYQPTPQPQPYRRAEFDSQIVVTKLSNSVEILYLLDANLVQFVAIRPDGNGWVVECGNTVERFDTYKAAERAARGRLVDEALEQEQQS